MELFYRFINAIRSLFCRSRLEDEMAEEMAYHLKMTVEQNEANGMSPEEAQKAAIRQFGGVEQRKEECRDAWGTRFVVEIWRNARFGLRVLVKSKYFTIAALLTLGLCIGINTAIFSALNFLILRPLPFTESENLVEIYDTYPKIGVNRSVSNLASYVDFKANTDTFSDFALMRRVSGNIGEEGSPERVDGLQVTSDFFELLRVSPLLGSFFNEEHAIPGQDDVIVLSHSFWKGYFGEDQAIVGQQTMIDGNTFTILGVAPRSVEVMSPEAKLYRVWAWNPDEVNPNSRHSQNAQLIGRLKIKDSLAQAKAQIDVLDRRFYENASASFKSTLDRIGHIRRVVPLKKAQVGDIASRLYMLNVAALFVLMIGCVNISNLMLAQSNARTSEFAIRCGLGASPVTIGFQLIIESLLLAAGGCFMGIVLGWGGIELINRFSMGVLLSSQLLELDGTTLFFAVGLALATGLIVGLLPIFRIFRQNLMAEVRQSSRSSSTSRSSRLISSSLVCGQAALALMLLTGAGLLIVSFSKVLSKNFGFDPENVTIARIALPMQHYQEPESVFGFQERILETLRQTPGIDAVAIASGVPTSTGYSNNNFVIHNYISRLGEGHALNTNVSSGYFEVLSISLLQGRFFDQTDVANNRSSLIIDKSMAGHYFPQENSVGQRLAFGGPRENLEDWPVVVGVVDKVQHTDLNDMRKFFVYTNIFERPDREFSILVKSERSLKDIINIIKDRIQEIDPRLPIYGSGTMDGIVDRSLNSRRMIMSLLTIFAGVALILSVIGVYGSLAYNVSQQCKEIGTRLALGAKKGEILWLFLMQGIRKGVIGLSLGLVGAFALSRFMEGMLYEVEATDPMIYIVGVVVLFVATLLASYLPARRAANIQPMEALRAE